MQSAEMHTWLRSAATEVLETMCYMEVLGPLDAINDDETDWISTRLTFKGAVSGAFGVSAPYALARTMAVNLLGDEEAENERQRAADALGEISNMICGGFVRHFGELSMFDLSHPISDFAFAAATPLAIIERLQADSGPICVWTEME